MQQKNALILFARDPVIGQVKTRLQRFLAPETVLELYRRFLKDSIRLIHTVKGADRFIGVAPSDLSGFFSRLDGQFDVTLFDQTGKDLGEKMQHAFESRFAAGYEKVVIIGSDSPSLPPGYIEQAFAASKDLILGPSTDGGYYLIGMTQKFVDVMQGIDWGSERVLEQTLKRVQAQDVSLELLPLWYDVDQREDLLFLKNHLDLIAAAGLPAHSATREFLKELDLSEPETGR